jgi:competence protein ComEC
MIDGTIIDEPDRRPTVIKYTLQAQSLTMSGNTIPVSGRILINHYDQWPRFQYGDAVTVSGKLEQPGEFEDFSYENYLKRYDIHAVMYHSQIQMIHNGSSLSFYRPLYAVKTAFENRINQLLPEPHASLLAGLLTGSRRGIPEDLTEDFNATGLTHIIAISGTNITIILAIIGSLLFWLPLKWRFLPSVIAITCFTLFVGASSSVVRAAIMGSLGLLALQLGRQSDARLTMLWTLGIMSVWNPLQLWYDAGFQLSFFALAGLIELTPYIKPLLKRVPVQLGMRESLMTTLSAQIATAPWLFYLFGRLSAIAPLTNLLVAPLVPLAMLLGFTAVCVSILWFQFAQLIAYMAWACLQLIILIATVGSHIPLGSITIPQP